jgi:hypothetical protein
MWAARLMPLNACLDCAFFMQEAANMNRYLALPRQAILTTNMAMAPAASVHMT